MVGHFWTRVGFGRRIKLLDEVHPFAATHSSWRRLLLGDAARTRAL
jgi:hypothetical protein